MESPKIQDNSENRQKAKAAKLSQIQQTLSAEEYFEKATNAALELKAKKKRIKHKM